jgi:hypothetical protein
MQKNSETKGHHRKKDVVLHTSSIIHHHHSSIIDVVGFIEKSRDDRENLDSMDSALQK